MWARCIGLLSLLSLIETYTDLFGDQVPVNLCRITEWLASLSVFQLPHSPPIWPSNKTQMISLSTIHKLSMRLTTHFMLMMAWRVQTLPKKRLTFMSSYKLYSPKVAFFCASGTLVTPLSCSTFLPNWETLSVCNWYRTHMSTWKHLELNGMPMQIIFVWRLLNCHPSKMSQSGSLYPTLPRHLMFLGGFPLPSLKSRFFYSSYGSQK